MRRWIGLAALLACSCSQQKPAGNEAAAGAPAPSQLSLTRLDCGTAEFKDMNAFFSDKPRV